MQIEVCLKIVDFCLDVNVNGVLYKIPLLGKFIVYLTLQSVGGMFNIPPRRKTAIAALCVI